MIKVKIVQFKIFVDFKNWNFSLVCLIVALGIQQSNVPWGTLICKHAFVYC